MLRIRTALSSIGSKMSRKSPAKVAPENQRQRFIEAAKAAECDDDKDRFERRLGKIAKAKPKDESQKRKG